MNAAIALRRLCKLKKEWVGEGLEVFWVKRGLTIAAGEIRNMAEEDRMNLLKIRPRVYFGYAPDLYHACKIALSHLDGGQRWRAVETLRNILKRVPVQKRERALKAL